MKLCSFPPQLRHVGPTNKSSCWANALRIGVGQLEVGWIGLTVVKSPQILAVDLRCSKRGHFLQICVLSAVAAANVQHTSASSWPTILWVPRTHIRVPTRFPNMFSTPKASVKPHWITLMSDCLSVHIAIPFALSNLLRIISLRPLKYTCWYMEKTSIPFLTLIRALDPRIIIYTDGYAAHASYKHSKTEGHPNNHMFVFEKQFRSYLRQDSPLAPLSNPS